MKTMMVQLCCPVIFFFSERGRRLWRSSLLCDVDGWTLSSAASGHDPHSVLLTNQQVQCKVVASEDRRLLHLRASQRSFVQVRQLLSCEWSSLCSEASGTQGPPPNNLTSLWQQDFLRWRQRQVAVWPCLFWLLNSVILITPSGY